MRGRSVESAPQDVLFQTGSRVTAGSAPTAAPTAGRGERGSIRGERGSVQGRCGAGGCGGSRVGGVWGPLAQGRYLRGECAARGCRGPVPLGEGVLASVSAPALVFQ